MAFAVLLLYLIFTFVRPGEQNEALQDLQLMDVVSTLALMGAAFAVLMGRGPGLRLVQIPLLLAFATWALVSVVLSPVRNDMAFDSVLSFIKGSCTAFFLLLLNVDTVRRLRIVAVVLTGLGLFVVAQGAFAYHADQRSQFVVYTPGPSSRVGPEDPLLESVEPGESAPEDDRGLKRIRGLGFIKDPNDLACTLVAILPLSLALRRKGAFLRNGLIWICVLAIVYGVYLTRSRGGVVTLAVVTGLLIRPRIGRTFSILAAVGALMGLLALDFVGGRSMSMDDSARGRIEAWSEGIQMLKSSPIWGVGFSNYTLYNERVAHNSFVHCFAELGLVGYFLWLSLLVLTLADIRAVSQQKERDASELPRWAGALSLSLAGFLVGAFFLSRSYDVMLFMLLGVSIAMTNLAQRQGFQTGSRSLAQWLAIILAAEIASIISIWLYMRVF